MPRTLDVYLDQALAGHLVQDDSGQMTFRYDPDWLSNPAAAPLSCSLPLREAAFSQKECRGFFNGALPEEGNRKTIARILQISDKNDFAMLERIGGECAGAVMFVPEGSTPPIPDHAYRTLSDDELAEILRTLDRRPLLAGEKGIRLSLAGVQDKIAVKVDGNGRISLPLNYAPSTHILKPATAMWDGLVDNEWFCMTLARAAAIPAADVSRHRLGDIDYLLVSRYDRMRAGDGTIARLHQEDFCQALGIPSNIKYQSEGGPGLKECFALLRETSTSPVMDLNALFNAVIFNLVIGNNDAHAKNYSLLYRSDGTRRLAPLYDLVCTACYPEIENRLAMKIGGEANPDLVYPEELERFAREVGLAPALTRRRTSDIAQQIKESIKTVPAQDEITNEISMLIDARCDAIISRLHR